MYRKSILIVVLLFLVLSLTATVFPIEIRLNGYPELQGNKISFFKVPRTALYSYNHPFISNLLETDTEISVDHDKMMIVMKTKYSNTTLYPDIYLDFDSYLDRMFKQTLADKITRNSIQYILADDRQVESGIIPEITIKIPKEAIPKSMRTLLGDEQGKLNLDGSQRLTVTGRSTKRKTNVVYEGKDNSNFDLEMKQDLDLRLRGKIGEKISINLKHNSNVDEQLFDPNNIHIEYDGDDDEIVQKVEAGNISLSLSGSKYVSTSISSQGLFGVKGELQVGDLKVQAIFSEEEGQKNKQKYTGNSQQDSTIVYSRDYARRTHYYVAPMRDLFMVYTGADVETSNIPDGWADNAIKTDPLTGNWIAAPGSERYLPKPGTLKVYLDDGNANNDLTVTIPGDPILDSNGVQFTPMYEEQYEGVDYLIDYDLGLIKFLKDINRIYTIAIGYNNLLDEEQPSNFDPTVADGTLHLKVIRIRNQNSDYDDPNSRIAYQARNIYKLSIGNIKSEGFSLKVYTRNPDNTINMNIPDTIDDGGLEYYKDYLRLDSNNDQLINGDDTTVNLVEGAIYFPYIEPFSPLGDSLIYENDPENISYEDFSINMSVKGNISRERINLNQINILEGSVSVKVNGNTLSESVDYIVDYDMGEITFLNSKGKDPNAQIEIEYEFRSGFSIERKTMAGLRADMNIGDIGKIGTTLVFKSEKVTDEHPKIGNENYNMLLGDIDANVKVKPEFMTKMVDFLPLIKTTAESEISLSGEIAFSYIDLYGNNKTKAKEAYIDDMESILNPYPLGISRQAWNPASEPENIDFRKAIVKWFKQENIRANQVYDPATLTDDEEDDELNVLAVKLEPDSLSQNSRSWGGLMKYVGNEVDFSEMKYIQILLKAENYMPEISASNVTMHIDFGDISENFYTYNEITPELNTEDGANGGEKDGELEVREDVGLDGIEDELDDDDPGDNFGSSTDVEELGIDYNHINGSERNGILDTEDMDENGQLNTLNRYFEYTVEDITSSLDSEYLENEHNGWKLFRIPMSSHTIPTNSLTKPDLSKVKYARIWFEVNEKTKIYLVEFELVGNKYTERPIYEVYHPFSDSLESYIVVDSLDLAPEEDILVGISDNQKDYHYTSPSGTYEIEKSTPTLEQSLRLDINNLQPNHLGMVRNRETVSSNWLSYGKLKFWVYPEQDQESTYTDSVSICLRVGADSLNYYEVRYNTIPLRYQDKMIKSWWKEIEVDFSKFTSLKKFSPDNADTLFVRDGQMTYVRYKNPTLSAVQEISMGILIPEESEAFTGTVYFDDIRVAEPFNDMGLAYSVSLSTKFADFINFNIGYEQKTENFKKEITRNTVPSYVTTTNLDMTGKLFLHKFLPYDWGYNIPIQVSRDQSWGIPRYKANSDILRRDLESIYLEKEKNLSKTYSASVDVSKSASKPHWWTKYTLDSTTLSATATYTERNNPTVIDTTLTYSGTYSYNVQIPRDKIDVKIFRNYSWYFMPRSFDNTVTFRASQPKSWNFDTVKKDFFPALNSREERYVTTSNSVNYDILTDLSSSYRLTTKRDLYLKKYYKDINVGNETEHKQMIDLSYDPNYLPNIFTLSISPGVDFVENRRLLNGTNVVDNQYRFERNGSVNRVTNVNFILKNSDILSSISRSWSQKAGKKNSEKTINRDGDSSSSKDKPKPDKKESTQTNVDTGDKKEQPGKLEQEDSQADKKKNLQKLVDEGSLSEKDMYDKLNSPEFLGDGAFPEDNKGEKGNDTRKDRDERGKDNTPKNLFTYMSKLKNINISFDNTYNTTYQDLANRPGFAYQIGIPNSVSKDSLNSIKNENSISLNSGLDLTRSISLTTGYSYSLSTTEANSSSQTERTRFPDIGISISEFQKWIGIEQILTSSSLRSNYSLEVQNSGDFHWDKPNTVSKTMSLSPLINWNGNWLRNIVTQASYSYTQTETTTNRGGFDSVNLKTTNTINGSISYSFTAARGLKIPMFKKRMRLKNELTSGINFSYAINKDKTRGDGNTVINTDTSNFTFTPNLTYDFSKNIKGGMDIQYSNEVNHKRDESLRVFSSSLWAEIKF